jgi:hypothetical protein
MIGRTLIAQPRVRLVRDLLGEPGGKARFADPRLAGDQHDLPLAGPGPALKLQQLRALGLATDEAGEPRGMRGLEPALALRNPQRRPGFDRLGEALDRVLSEIAQAESIADESPRRRGQDYAAGLGEPLQPRCEVRGVADDGLFLRGALSDEIAHHDEPGRYSDAHGEYSPRPRLQSGDYFGDLQSRVHRPRCVVLMCARKAEVGENAVAHEFGDEAVIARDDTGDGVLIGADDLAHVLGIKPCRHCGGADEVREHDGELAAFGGIDGRRYRVVAAEVATGTSRPIAFIKRLRSPKVTPS